MELQIGNLYISTVFFLRLLWNSIYTDWSKSSDDHGLTVTEETSLWVIWLLGSATITEIASGLQRDKGTISKAMFSLEENGFVEREAGVDRRSYEFRISPAGDVLRRNLERVHGRDSAFARAFSTLSEEERNSFARIAMKLAAGIEGETYARAAVQHLAKIQDIKMD